MRDENKWATIHTYRRAVAQGAAPAILCPDCKGELLPVVGKGTEPELRCLSCRSVFNIALHVWNQINSNLKEYNEQY